MLDLAKLEEKQEDLIAELDEDKLKQYIKHLVKKFYESYISGNKENYEATVKLLMAVMKIHKFNYANLVQYIYYCLVDYSFKLFNTAFSSEFDLEHLVESDLNNNNLNSSDVLRMEYEKAIEKQSELASYIWIELTRRADIKNYMFFLDHEDRRNFNKLHALVNDPEVEVPEDVLELVNILFENISETTPYKKTYHNFSKYQQDIIEEIKAYHKEKEKEKIRIKELEKEIEELKQQLEGAVNNG